MCCRPDSSTGGNAVVVGVGKVVVVVVDSVVVDIAGENTVGWFSRRLKQTRNTHFKKT